MLTSIRIRLKPTKEQEELFWKSAGTARWAYNFFLSESIRHYNEYTQGIQKYASPREGDVRKYINNVLKPTTHTWLKEVGSNVMKQAVRDADSAMQRYLSGVSNKPRFKSRHHSKNSFYVNYESFRRTREGFRGEKIKSVRTAYSLPKLERNQKYSNPRISHDGRHWYLSISYPLQVKEVLLTEERLGIDIGITYLAVCSNKKVYKNINKEQRVMKLEKKLKREQRKLSRKTLANLKGYSSNGKTIYLKPLSNRKNIQKQKDKVRILYKKLSNIRQNHLHQVTNEIVKTKPSCIIMETLNIKGMLKNQYLSKAVSQQKLYEFKRQIRYKSEKYGITFIEANRWFPSSKMCSSCGEIQSGLSLKVRIYRCQCGLEMDRDLNASINLANYSNKS